jgi:hypothetical protein
MRQMRHPGRAIGADQNGSPHSERFEGHLSREQVGIPSGFPVASYTRFSKPEKIKLILTAKNEAGIKSLTTSSQTVPFCDL